MTMRLKALRLGVNHPSILTSRVAPHRRFSDALNPPMPTSPCATKPARWPFGPRSWLLGLLLAAVQLTGSNVAHAQPTAVVAIVTDTDDWAKVVALAQKVRQLLPQTAPAASTDRFDPSQLPQGSFRDALRLVRGLPALRYTRADAQREREDCVHLAALLAASSCLAISVDTDRRFLLRMVATDSGASLGLPQDFADRELARALIRLLPATAPRITNPNLAARKGPST